MVAVVAVLFGVGFAGAILTIVDLRARVAAMGERLRRIESRQVEELDRQRTERVRETHGDRVLH